MGPGSCASGGAVYAGEDTAAGRGCGDEGEAVRVLDVWMLGLESEWCQFRGRILQALVSPFGFWLLFVDDGGRNAVWDDLIELIYAVLQLLGKLQKIEDPLCLIERPIGAMDSSTLIRLELRLKQLYESYVYDVLNT